MAHLPGQSVGVSDDEWGTKCYSHPDVEATHRICVESDSFGSEYANLCDVCWEERNKAIEEQKNDPEQWEQCKCGNREPRLISYRDMDEGMHGPVYEHCSVCHAKMNARIAAEEEYYNDDEDYYPEPDIEYEPEPNYEDVTESELQVIADYLKREYRLPFTVTRSDKKTGESDLSLSLVITGNKAYRRFNKRFKSFIAKDIDNSLIDVTELKDAICGTADDLDAIILNRRISDRKIAASKLTMSPSFAELVKMAQERIPFKPKLSKEFITPVYSISIMVSKVYWS